MKALAEDFRRADLGPRPRAILEYADKLTREPGRIPPCVGLIAFAETLRQCEDELRSTLEDWILVGLKLGHPLPVLAGIDLDQQPVHESMEAV